LRLLERKSFVVVGRERGSRKRVVGFVVVEVRERKVEAWTEKNGEHEGKREESDASISDPSFLWIA